MRSLAPIAAFLMACGGTVVVEQVPGPDQQMDPTPSGLCAAEPPGRSVTVANESVSGVWSGEVSLTGRVTVEAGQSLEICPGTTITPADATTELVVDGELALSGTRDAMITFAEMPWLGIDVTGQLSGGYVSISGATVCIEGKPGAKIEVVAALLIGCGQGFGIQGDARLDRVTVVGGGTIVVNAGVLTMVDSTIDLRHPTAAPDCTKWGGGGAVLDHVRFTGCHCPIHINNAPMGFTVTNSIFDAAAVPIMIAKTEGSFTHNHILEGRPQLLDVGGNISVDFAGNYWGGGAPNATSGDMSQFRGLDDFSASEFTDVGPR